MCYANVTEMGDEKVFVGEEAQNVISLQSRWFLLFSQQFKLKMLMYLYARRNRWTDLNINLGRLKLRRQKELKE